MPIRTLRRSVLLRDLSRIGFAGLRFAVILLLAAAALRTSSLAWIGAGTLIASLVLWLACLPTTRTAGESRRLPVASRSEERPLNRLAMAGSAAALVAG